MDRVNRILHNEVYVENRYNIELLEKDRIYCKHGEEHALDVARIAMLINLTEQCGLEKETVYAAAILHDIGRAQEYREGKRHEEAGQMIASVILKECLFHQDEIDDIMSAIANHRDKSKINLTKSKLGEIISRADHLSRPCYKCMATQTCKWSYERRNEEIQW